MVAADAFDRDPLRPVRVARLGAELGFAVDPATRAAARRRAGAVRDAAAERVFGELRRLLACDGAVAGLRLLDDLALTPAVLPEVAALHGVEQSAYHHLDVHAHTLAVLEGVIDLERDPAAVLAGGSRPAAGGDLAGGVAALLAEPLADGLTRGGALRWGALLHDVAKPPTRVELPGGRVGFPRHDVAGAAMARDVLARLRAAERLRAHVAALTRQHLRLGFLVHAEPLDRRAVHRYLVACAPVAADVTLLSVADRLATRGRKADEAIARHLALARRLLAAALERRSAPPKPPLLRGDVLARELGLVPGPWLGELLAELEEARYAGEVATPEEAVAHARARLAAGGQPSARDAR
jgi:putative nucleotidyltransferase with HDIG domain